MAHCDPLKKVIEAVAHLLGCTVQRLKQLHVIRQRSRQCQFTWHRDDVELTGVKKKLSPQMVTTVILLNGGHTGMQMWRFRPFTYPGTGSGAIFPGAATHRTIYQVMGSPRDDLDVLKVGMFWD